MKRLIVSLFVVATAAVIPISVLSLQNEHQTLNQPRNSTATRFLADGTAPPVPDVPLNLQNASATVLVADGTAPPVPDVPLSLHNAPEPTVTLADGTAPPVPDVPLKLLADGTAPPVPDVPLS
jgi:hypothetical protein